MVDDSLDENLSLRWLDSSYGDNSTYLIAWKSGRRFARRKSLSEMTRLILRRQLDLSHSMEKWSTIRSTKISLWDDSTHPTEDNSTYLIAWKSGRRFARRKSLSEMTRLILRRQLDLSHSMEKWSTIRSTKISLWDDSTHPTETTRLIS